MGKGERGVMYGRNLKNGEIVVFYGLQTSDAAKALDLASDERSSGLTLNHGGSQLTTDG